MTEYRPVYMDRIIEFLEVALNNVLYSRTLYPRESFIEKKMYSTILYVCQHPEVKEYMEKVLSAIRELINADFTSVVTVTLNVVDKNMDLLEKYVFNIQRIQDDIPLEKDPYFIRFEDHLRTVCLKLSMATSYLEPLPEDSTFTIDVSTSQRSYLALSKKHSTCESFPWILTNRESIDNDVTSLLPLTYIKSQNVAIELYVLKKQTNP